MQIKNMVLAGLFAALTALGSLIYIPLPFSPVPLTLQLFFALLAGGLLGKKLGVISQLIYLLLGAAGLPVFAGGIGGPGALIGPSCGYLYGFLPAAFFAGMGKNSLSARALFMVIGLISVYILGIIGLMLNTGLGLSRALASGVLPFLVGDLFKLLLASYLSTRIPIDRLN